jgi:large subunit ribosomal protein L9
MKVILTEEIRGLGTRGDVVTVKDGYARNYLIPKNLAQEATKGNLHAIEHQRRKWALLAQEEKAAAQKQAQSVKGIKIQIEKRGRVWTSFGSVRRTDRGRAAREGHRGRQAPHRLGSPIKNVGVHDVEVRLHRDVSASIQVEVVPMGVERLEEEPSAEQPAAD